VGDTPAGDGSGEDLHASGGVFLQAGQSSEQRSEWVDVVIHLQRIVLGLSETQLAASYEPRSRERRKCLGGLGSGSRPCCLDGSLDHAGRDYCGDPEGDPEAARAGGQLEAQVRLPGKHPPPGRAQESDQIGPDRDCAMGVDLRRSEHVHEAGTSGQPIVLPAAHDHCP
jgi:hypothetical protein